MKATRIVRPDPCPWLCPSPVQASALIDKLTPRQREVAVACAHGMRFEEIARAFGITTHRVNNIVQEITKRIQGGSGGDEPGARGAVAIGCMAWRAGLIPAGSPGAKELMGRLTETERRVAVACSHGMRAREVASLLGIDCRDAWALIASAGKRVGLRGAIALACLAWRAGMAECDPRGAVPC